MILRSSASILAPSLAYIFNQSLSTSTVPKLWKKALVVPLYKGKGDQSQPCSYRPISLLSTVSKVFENLLAVNLQLYLCDNNTIHENQFAYIRGRSINDHLALMMQELASIQDTGGRFECTSLDFCKAFDRVDHSTLLKCFSQHASLPAVAWLKDFLSGREISVKVNNVRSSFHPVTCGVPQGSHLSPLLFILFVNSLPHAIKHSSVYLYADDVTLIYKHCSTLSLSDNIKRAEKDVMNCQNWARDAKGEFSASKSVHIRNHSASQELSLDSASIPPSANVKHLGVLLSPDLCFRDHFDNIYLKFRQRTNLLRLMASSLHPASLLLLYKSYVRPTVEYATPCWFPSMSITLLNKLDIVQAAFARSLCRKLDITYQFDEPKSSLNKLCTLQSLQFRRQILCLVSLQKIIFRHPQYLARFNFRVSSSHRRPNHIILPPHSRMLSQQFFFQFACLWNTLPDSLTSSSVSCVQFKKEISRHFIAYQYATKGIPMPH